MCPLHARDLITMLLAPVGECLINLTPLDLAQSADNIHTCLHLTLAYMHELGYSHLDVKPHNIARISDITALAISSSSSVQVNKHLDYESASFVASKAVPAACDIE